MVWQQICGPMGRMMFFHAIALACLAGIFVMMQAYASPLNMMVL